MKWDPGHQSDDVEDRRGDPEDFGGSGMGGAMAFAPLLLRTRYGWVILLLLLGAGWVRGHLSSGAPAAPENAGPSKLEDRQAQFVAFVLDDVQSTWDQILTGTPATYRHAKLTLFTNRTRTGCGMGEAATGPFYCPADEHAYIDLGFYAELSGKLGAKGEFAQAYVIAHEIGHHVQKILGISDKVDRAPRGAMRGETGLSVRMELQADCFAGIWAKSTDNRRLLEAGDIDSALGAAAAVGDDRLEQEAEGTVHPESWTHGSSAERSRWFKRGYETGSIGGCNTFATEQL